MLTRNVNNDTKTMLIIELFANNRVWKYMYIASKMKCGKFNNFTRFRSLLDTIIRVMFFKKICEARWHAVSIVLFLPFCGETAYLVRFIEL